MAKLKRISSGKILREEFMKPLRLNPNKLALALHVPAPTVYDIVHEERGIIPGDGSSSWTLLPHHARFLLKSSIRI